MNTLPLSVRTCSGYRSASWRPGTPRTGRAVARGVKSAQTQKREWSSMPVTILPEHVHLLIRKHRDQAETMRSRRCRVRAAPPCRASPRKPDHPVWGGQGWKVYLETRADMQRTITYIRKNLIHAGRRAELALCNALRRLAAGAGANRTTSRPPNVIGRRNRGTRLTTGPLSARQRGSLMPKNPVPRKRRRRSGPITPAVPPTARAATANPRRCAGLPWRRWA